MAMTASVAQAAPLSTQGEPKLHFALGPTVSALHRSSAWDSKVGAGAYLAWDRPSSSISTLGTLVELSGFGGTDATRLTADLFLGIQLSDFSVGIGIGPLLDLFPNHRPQYGVRSTVWLFAGITPYLSISSISGLGAPEDPEIEVGLKIPFPAISW